METMKTSNFTCQSKSFISIFFTCQVSVCELQPFSCHNLAHDIYSQTPKTVFSHLKGEDSFTAHTAWKNWQGTPKSLIEILTSLYTGRVSKDAKDTYAKLEGASLLDGASTWSALISLVVWVRRYLDIACENIRFSSLFGDVSRRTSPATKSEEKRMFLQANFDTGTPKSPGHHRPYWPASKLSIYGERSERWNRKGRKEWFTSFFAILLTFVMKQRRK